MTLRWLNAGFLAAALLGGCGDFWPGKPVPSVTVSDTSDAGFLSIYVENCAACHGDNGQSGAARPLNDPLYLAITPKASFAKTLSHGQGILMPAYLESQGGPMSESELSVFVDDLYAYWGDTKKAGIGDTHPSWQVGDGGDVKSGGNAFATWCGACHGQDGTGLGEKAPIEGARNGKSVVDEFYLRITSDQGLRSAVIFGHPEFGMPSYKGPFPGKDSKGMDEQAIDDIVAWLIAQRVTVKQQAERRNHE